MIMGTLFLKGRTKIKIIYWTYWVFLFIYYRISYKKCYYYEYKTAIFISFAVEYLEKDWTYPRELFGIGKYGDDSYRMFCINEWQQVSPDDIPLTLYRNWLQENADCLGIN